MMDAPSIIVTSCAFAQDATIDPSKPNLTKTTVLSTEERERVFRDANLVAPAQDVVALDRLTRAQRLYPEISYQDLVLWQDHFKRMIDTEQRSEFVPVDKVVVYLDRATAADCFDHFVIRYNDDDGTEQGMLMGRVETGLQWHYFQVANWHRADKDPVTIEDLRQLAQEEATRKSDAELVRRDRQAASDRRDAIRCLRAAIVSIPITLLVLIWTYAVVGAWVAAPAFACVIGAVFAVAYYLEGERTKALALTIAIAVSVSLYGGGIYLQFHDRFVTLDICEQSLNDKVRTSNGDVYHLETDRNEWDEPDRGMLNNYTADLANRRVRAKVQGTRLYREITFAKDLGEARDCGGQALMTA